MSWYSKKQSTVALSSINPEYVALSRLNRHFFWGGVKKLVLKEAIHRGSVIY